MMGYSMYQSPMLVMCRQPVQRADTKCTLKVKEKNNLSDQQQRKRKGTLDEIEQIKKKADKLAEKA